MDSKISKKYKNVYVVFEPSGIQIINRDENTLINKSPKLRDMLMPYFNKMRKIRPDNNISLFNLIFKHEKQDFTNINNKELSMEMINEVHKYLSYYIMRLLPSRVEI